TLFSILWEKTIRELNKNSNFPYLKVVLTSNHSLQGQLFDLVDKDFLILKRGNNHLHIPWREIEYIEVFDKAI
ncbi:hypothetical protein, partial [Thermococcus sp.]